MTGEESGGLGWSREELCARRKGDPAKMALAGRLRRETTLTVKAIPERLHEWMRGNPAPKAEAKTRD
jgi:hypothetical protein